MNFYDLGLNSNGTMKNLIIFCFFFLFGVQQVEAQIDIRLNGESYAPKGETFYYCYDSAATFDFTKEIGWLWKRNWIPFTNEAIKTSGIPYTLYLKIPIKQKLDEPIAYINIDNPHINFIHGWLIDKGQVLIDYGVTGDNLAHKTRPLPTQSFVFPIPENVSDSPYFIVALDKRFTKMELPIYLCSEDYFLYQYFTNHFLIYILIGLFIFILILNFYLFISIREQLYLWYSIYMLCFIFALSTDLGLMFMYLYPNLPSLNDLIRPIVISISIIPMLFFFNRLLDIRTNALAYYKINRFIIILYGVLAILAIVTSFNDQFKTQGMWLTIQRILSPTILFIMIYEAFSMFRRKIRYASFALASLLTSSIFFIIFILNQAGLVEHNDFTKNTMYIGLFCDAMIMALAMTWKFKIYQKQAEFNLQEQEKMENMLGLELSNFQKAEMSRISSMLHDNIGAKMGLLRLETENMPLDEKGRNEIAKQITSISEEIRQISHGFSPMNLKEKGIYESILFLIRTILKNSKVDIQFEWIGDRDKIPHASELLLYRFVQELLQNMMKHADAKQVILQIIYHENLISLYYEDDGTGSLPDQLQYGMGLKNMKRIAALLKGRFHIETSPKNGFCVSIEFKPTKNENV
jgi:signal transduction histidine kinase